MIILSIFLIINFLVVVYESVMATLNPFFDGIYIIILWVLVCILLAAVILVFYFLCAIDTPGGRAVLPWAFLIAAIVNFLIFIWICVYFYGIYQRDKVWLPRGQGGEEDYEKVVEEDENHKSVTYKKSDHVT